MEIFKGKKEPIVGYCPQCDKEILKNDNKKFDGSDWWHLDCYQNFMDMINVAKPKKEI